jgi:hypothetical protein
LKPTIFNYDLKYGSKVIWGDELIFNLIPDFLPQQITLKDVEILYFTRLYTFLGSLDENGFEVGVENEKARFFKNQMAKAILSMVDIELIKKGLYNTSYRERVKILAKFYPENNWFLLKANWALNEKLNPSNEAMNSEQVTEFYKKIIFLFIDKMFAALSEFFSTRIRSTDDIRLAKLYSFDEFVLSIKYLLISKSFGAYRKMLRINLLQSYIAESYILTGIHKNNQLEKCKSIINEYLPDKNLTNSDWNQLRVLTAELRIKGL